MANPVMTASGTAGHGVELAEYGDLSALGALVVKSLAAQPWAGNPSPRVHEVGAGMLNSVGLQRAELRVLPADKGLSADVATIGKQLSFESGNGQRRARSGKSAQIAQIGEVSDKQPGEAGAGEFATKRANASLMVHGS